MREPHFLGSVMAFLTRKRQRAAQKCTGGGADFEDDSGDEKRCRYCFEKLESDRSES
jgi:hypothetical protein